VKKSISTKTSPLLCIFVFLISSFLVVGCKAKKKIAEDSGISAYSSESVFYKIKAANLQYDYLEAKGKATINSPDMNISGDFILRLKADDTAWMVVKKFGFEAARILIKNDTATVLNRLQKAYMQGSVQSLSKRASLSMGQDEIIDFLAGNMIIDYGEFMSMSQDSFDYEYKTASDDMIVTYLFNAITETVDYASFADMQNSSAECAYNDYRLIDDIQMTSYQRILSTDDPRIGETTITLDFKDITLNNPLKFPFEIPSNYSKVNM